MGAASQSGGVASWAVGGARWVVGGATPRDGAGGVASKEGRGLAGPGG